VARRLLVIRDVITEDKTGIAVFANIDGVQAFICGHILQSQQIRSFTPMSYYKNYGVFYHNDIRPVVM
jgi:hypothetical protein